MQLNVRPSGTLYLKFADSESLFLKEFASELSKSSGRGLLYLDSHPELSEKMPELNYWLDFVRLFLTLFCSDLDIEKSKMKFAIPELNLEDLSRFLYTIPLCEGSEYINRETLNKTWQEIALGLVQDINESEMTVEDYFKTKHQRVSLMGNVWFHLAENKNNADTPFAFLATYTHKVSENGKSQHLPLNRALETYSSKNDRQILLRLLSPLNKAEKESKFLKQVIDSGEIYHPQMWGPQLAFKFLKDIPIFEKSGIVVRVPNWWKAKNPSRPQVTASLGDKSPGVMGYNSLLDFTVSVKIGNLNLTEKEIRELLNKTENLVFFKGQWIEVDAEKLGHVLKKWKEIEKRTKKNGLSFLEGMRMLAGLETNRNLNSEFLAESSDESISWKTIEAGPWLNEVLDGLKSPENTKKVDLILKKSLQGKLRFYQQQGVNWLNFLDQLNLGACLADDMGLGKTIQVISLLLIKKDSHKESTPNLLIVPASLIGNWKSELKKFAPSLKFHIAHSSEDGLKEPLKSLTTLDLVITTYATLLTVAWPKEVLWGLVILDEAQAIKNPDSKQSKIVKTLKSQNRLALTGTPVENKFGDLWSLFDFVAPGLLGTSSDFGKFMKGKKNEDKAEISKRYGIIRNLVKPYILRRLKTDKNIIDDLPDKTELKTYCNLSKSQIFLYQECVASLQQAIENSDGIKRRGIILSYLIRFKQICNHPSHWLKDNSFAPEESGKYARLQELIETIKSKQEKILVFTQFQEMTEPLANFLENIFGQEGLILHGKTPVGKRKELVEKFQKEDGPPFFVLSLKAGGTGLNLTQASHVIHFDRWWNPATENQATDRAFRIGQKNNVMVHKFICQGTLEEKIDALIESKVKIASELIESSDGPSFTELSNSELLNLVSLDLKHSIGEI
jgi:non-specific serine/threonine protein kinase